MIAFQNKTDLEAPRTRFCTGRCKSPTNKVGGLQFLKFGRPFLNQTHRQKIKIFLASATQSKAWLRVREDRQMKWLWSLPMAPHLSCM